MTGLQIGIDCHDPSAQVRFWCLALDYEPQPPPAGYATWRDRYLAMGVPEEELEGDCTDRIQDPGGTRPQIWFQVVPEAKTVKNRVHLDVIVGRGLPMDERRRKVDERAALLEAAGATRLVVHETYHDHYGITLQDPEGNEFCVT